MKFKIRYALSGGFGGCENKDWETIEAINLLDAEKQAEEMARDEYFSMEGMYGLFNAEEELEEDPDLTKDDIHAMQEEDIDSWIDFEAREV